MRRGLLILGVGLVGLGLILKFAGVIDDGVLWIFIGLGTLVGLGSLIT